VVPEDPLGLPVALDFRSRGEKEQAMRVIVDQDKCVASGQCVLSAGAVLDQRDEDGIVFLPDDRPPAELHDDVRRAAALCPARAITVVEP
jgi:ferredoxin